MCQKCVSNKKIYPKFGFPTKSKKWMPRVRTTDTSLCLMIERVQTQHAAQNPTIRMKMTPHVAETMAESAAAVLAVAQDSACARVTPKARMLTTHVASKRAQVPNLIRCKEKSANQPYCQSHQCQTDRRPP